MYKTIAEQAMVTMVFQHYFALVMQCIQWMYELQDIHNISYLLVLTLLIQYNEREMQSM